VKDAIYPGKYEDISKESKEITQEQGFSGGRFAFNKPFFPESMNSSEAVSSKQCVAGVQTWLSPQIPDGASNDFSAQTILEGGRYILAAQLSMAGAENPARVHGRVIANNLILQQATGKLAFNVVPENPRFNQCTGELEYKGRDFSTKGMLLAQGGALLASANYLQTITPTISAGLELEGHLQQKLSNFGAALRYSTLKKKLDGESYVLALDTSKMLSLSYLRRIDQTLTVTSCMQYTFPRDTQVQTGFLFKKRLYSFHGNVDSTGKVASLLETAVFADANGLRMTFSAELNQATNESNFGYGLSVG